MKNHIEPYFRKKNLLFLLSITFAALCLRVLMLNSQSLWMDEAEVYSQIIGHNLQSIYVRVFNHGGHVGPLFYILNHLFCLVFGYSEWAFRMPSVIYGTISVVLVYKITEILINQKTAMLSSFLMALSPLHIWYSQEARMYSLWIMFVLCITFIFIKILKENKLWLWIIFTILSSLSIWTFLNSVFIFFALGFYLLIYIKRYRTCFFFYLISMVIVFVSYLPGILPLLAKGSNIAATTIGSSRKTTVFDISYSFLVFNVGTSFGPPLLTIRDLVTHYGAAKAVRQILSQYGILIIPSMLLYGSIFSYSIYKAMVKIKSPNNTLILVLLFVPMFFVFGITLLSSQMPFNVRYILCSLPFYLILLSIALNGLSEKKRRVLLICMIFFFSYSLFNHYFNSDYSKIDLRSLSQYLNKNMSDSDNAVIVHEGADLILRYYDKSGRLKKYFIPYKGSFDKASSIINGSGKIFYVKTERIQKYNPKTVLQIENLLTSDFHLVDTVSPAKKIEVKIYER
jgi:mannosyltransferase